MNTALLAALLGVLAISAQHVVIGSDGPNYCDSAKIRANLHVPSPLKLKGRILDETGAAFANSVVEVRHMDSDTKQTTIAKVSTDSEGRFNLGKLNKGEYRFLA